MKKKLLAVIMSCFVIAMLCVGCGGQEEETDVSVNDVAESTEPEVSSTDDDSIVETVNGYKRFKVTKDEFISRYNEAIDFLNEEENGTVNELDHFDSRLYSVDVVDDSAFPNAYQKYAYDISPVITSGDFTGMVNIFVDDEEHVIEVNIQYKSDCVSEDVINALVKQKGPAVYAALMNKSVSSIYSEFIQNIQNSDMAYGNSDYGYDFRTIDNIVAFAMSVSVN